MANYAHSIKFTHEFTGYNSREIDSMILNLSNLEVK